MAICTAHIILAKLLCIDVIDVERVVRRAVGVMFSCPACRYLLVIDRLSQSLATVTSHVPGAKLKSFHTRVFHITLTRR